MTKSLVLHDVAVKSDDNVISSTRRSFLSALPGLAAASAVPAVLGSPKVVHAATEPSLAAEGVHENPDLLQAYAGLIAACAELAAAEDALEWLADEWRHLWPLAPEELLGAANVHLHYGHNDGAERDIIGRFMMRETADLTKRLARKYREENRKTCFHIFSSAEAKEHIAKFSRQIPKGRTEKALARNQAWIEGGLASWNRTLVLAERYEAETARLRHESGVQAAKQRIADADLAVCKSRTAISKIPAFTHKGLFIKGEALKMTGLFDGSLAAGGLLGEVSNFIRAVADVTGRTTA
ncbi:hypothetical protein [Rhizobium lusitanum]|uniref:Uncharacterized protein n=1 Tax=Rhizobium lusitanum TaxID=293958 RepID=A0A1C3URV0_9HYPH|nr:hypothetical protein [Rhizobium lusitanum]SCB18178.1 hypothetical protein GA0061101_103229 [Rhizobium lusitanum]